EDVVYAEVVEEVADALYPLSPPGEFLVGVGSPVVEGNSPVLAPLLNEEVPGEYRLRRGAARPVQFEKLPLGPDIGAVPAHAEGNVSHQAHSVAVGERSHVRPLRESNPLNKCAEVAIACQSLVLPGGRQPGFGSLPVSDFRLPGRPRGVAAV